MEAACLGLANPCSNTWKNSGNVTSTPMTMETAVETSTARVRAARSWSAGSHVVAPHDRFLQQPPGRAKVSSRQRLLRPLHLGEVRSGFIRCVQSVLDPLSDHSRSPKC